MSVVVVGVDLSVGSMRALREGLREAAWRDASVVAVYAVPVPAYAGIEGAYGFSRDEIRSAAHEALEERLAEFRVEHPEFAETPIETRVSVGHAGTKILEAAGDLDADLVVLGSRGLGGFKGLLVGSVTTYAVHHLHRPLLIVPAAHEGGEAHDPA